MALLNSIVNGEVTSEISIQDRGLHYGDGLFETIAFVNNQLVFWNEHYQRLLTGCKILDIQCPTEQSLKKGIEKLRHLNPDVKSAVIKIIVTRGDSERGYRSPEELESNVVILLSTYPDYPAACWNEGVKVKKCETVLSSQQQLAGLKHLNRLEQVLARQEWADEYQEGLMSDLKGDIIEGVMSNVFIVEKGTVRTPLIKHAGVKGIMRNIVLKLCEAHGIMVVEDEISFEQVLAADEVFLTNSIIGIWPVKQITKQTYMTGLITKNIMKLLIEKYSVDYAAPGL